MGGDCDDAGGAGGAGDLAEVGEEVGLEGVGALETGDLAGDCEASLEEGAVTAGLEEGAGLGAGEGAVLTGVGTTRGEADPVQERLSDCGEERGEEGARREEAGRAEDWLWKKFLRLAMEEEMGEPERPPSRSRVFFSSSSWRSWRRRSSSSFLS